MTRKPIDRGWWDGTRTRKIIHDTFWYAVGVFAVLYALSWAIQLTLPFWFRN